MHGLETCHSSVAAAREPRRRFAVGGGGEMRGNLGARAARHAQRRHDATRYGAYERRTNETRNACSR